MFWFENRMQYPFEMDLYLCAWLFFFLSLARIIATISPTTISYRGNFSYLHIYIYILVYWKIHRNISIIPPTDAPSRPSLHARLWILENILEWKATKRVEIVIKYSSNKYIGFRNTKSTVFFRSAHLTRRIKMRELNFGHWVFNA